MALEAGEILSHPSLPLMGEYAPLLLQGGITAALLLLLAFLARLLGHYPRFGSGGRAPTSAYECGFAPFAGLATTSLFLFFRLAVFFVVFEAELVFLYPWASALLPAAGAGLLLPFLAPLPFLVALFWGYGREISADALRVLGVRAPEGGDYFAPPSLPFFLSLPFPTLSHLFPPSFPPTLTMLLTAAKLIGAGLATISLAGAGVGIGSVFGAFQLALSRNPGLLAVLFRYALLGFVLTEAIALFGLMMAFLILFAF